MQQKGGFGWRLNNFYAEELSNWWCSSNSRFFPFANYDPLSSSATLLCLDSCAALHSFLHPTTMWSDAWTTVDLWRLWGSVFIDGL